MKVIIGLALVLMLPAPAESIEKTPAVVYFEKIGRISRSISESAWEYVKVSADRKRSGEAAKKRKETIQKIENSIIQISAVEPFEGDSSYREAVLVYLRDLNAVMRDDYATIVSIEKNSEESFSALEAYLNMKEKADRKLDIITVKLKKAEEKFADANSVALSYRESDVTKKFRIASDVTKYYNSVYLPFFKAFKQESVLLDAVNSGDLQKIDSGRLLLHKVSNEGLDTYKSIKPYSGDLSLVKAASAFLDFFAEESVKHTKNITDYVQKKDAFEKIRKEFNAKKDSERTKVDADNYNAKAGELNDAGKKYNESVNELNKKRAELISRWNIISAEYFDRHIPR